MSTTLSVIAIVVLLAIIVVSLKRQHRVEGRQKEVEDRARRAPGEAQNERFLLRQARLTDAGDERARVAPADAEDRETSISRN
jgi:hypothetical protein